MLKAAWWTLRQPRYAGLAALMFVIAVICVVAGTWQISRYEQEVHDNKLMDANAHAAAAPLTRALVPIVGTAPRPSREAIRFRTVTTSGTYLTGSQQFVRDQSLNGTSGYYVLVPVRTDTGVILVVRGFVADNGEGTPPPTVTAPPSGVVRLTGRLQTASTGNDGARELTHSEIESINPAEQGARLGAPVFDAYLSLNAGQPGASGVTVLSDPDLSNPSGGAVEPQHLAYIVQWYLFALLALAAPFAIGRSEVREARRRFLGLDPGQREFDDRPQLDAGLEGAGGAVAVRESGALATRGEPSAQQWQRAAQLADRYGRSLGNRSPEVSHDATAVPTPGGRPQPAEPVYTIPNIASQPARSVDDYQGDYNDYLWQLAMADGNIPTVTIAEDEAPQPPAPRVLDADPVGPDDPR